MTHSATRSATISTTHTAFIAAPPRVVYGLIADSSRWPHLFPTVLHVERLSGGAAEERLRMWAVGNGAVRDRVSRRRLDADSLRIRFRQELPSAPMASFAGEWIFVPLPGDATSVVLLHEFRAVDDDPHNAALIRQAVDRNSTADLTALKDAAELGGPLPALPHSFADSVSVQAPPEPVYDFLHRAADWPRHLAHLSRLVLDEAVPNLQTIEMDTLDPDGSTRTVRMVRACYPRHGIVYKQTEPTGLLRSHVGEWRLHPGPDGVRVTARNTVVLRPEAAAEVDPVESVRQGLRRNCMAILLQAKAFAEGGAAGAGPRREPGTRGEAPGGRPGRP